MPDAPPAQDLRDLYLDTVERALTHSLYGFLDLRLEPGPTGVRNRAIRALLGLFRSRGIEPVRLLADPGDEREQGLDWPVFAQTMIGRRRLANVRACTESLVADEVPGDLIEAGVWRGGAAIMMRAVLAAYGDDRRVWLADSFAGLPPPEPERYPADAGAQWHRESTLAISMDEVRENFRRYGLLDEKVKFLQGWFSETLPGVADRKWSLIRLDGDMYGSTIEPLRNLYSGLSPGGYLIVDEYRTTAAVRRAVDDYRQERGIVDPIEPIDKSGVFWRRDR